jgi:hypothetical protein
MPMGWLPGEQKIQDSSFAADSFLVDGKSTRAVFSLTSRSSDELFA